MEKAKTINEAVNRFNELINYNFQPKGFGFIETPANSEEIKEKLVIKEDEQPKEEKKPKSDEKQIIKEESKPIKKEVVKEQPVKKESFRESLKEEIVKLAKKYGSKNPELIYESIKGKVK